uniref:MULE transposase domain-containing protein n=1 Tax=Panagrolaimus superbus TaxID=310955 RepID=A0A914Z2J8_9BILA
MANCKVRAITTVFDNSHHRIQQLKGNHNHEVSSITTAAKRAGAEVASRARITTERVVDIVNTVRTTVPLIVQQTMPDVNSLKRRANRVRQNENGFPSAPPNLEELVVPDNLKNISMRDPNGGENIEEPFVVHDSGPETGNRRFLIFSCALLLQLLSTSANWFLDATFKTVPNLAYQLLVVSAQFNNNRSTIPCAYILLNSKDRNIYEDAFSALKNLVGDFSPETAMMDFEIGLHLAFLEVFPESHLSACFFHLCENIRRKIADVGLKVAVRDNHQLARSMAMFRALAFVPLEHVPTGFELLKHHLTITYRDRPDFPLIEEVINYFETNYVGTRLRNGRRNQPLLARELWNVYEKTLESSPRTNNGMEGSHNKLHSFFDCDHPSFFKFIDLLRKHVKGLEADIFDLRAGKNVSRPMSQAWALLEHRKINLLETFQPNDILGFLTEMAGLLAST